MIRMMPKKPIAIRIESSWISFNSRLQSGTMADSADYSVLSEVAGVMLDGEKEESDSARDQYQNQDKKSSFGTWIGIILVVIVLIFEEEIWRRLRKKRKRLKRG